MNEDAPRLMDLDSSELMEFPSEAAEHPLSPIEAESPVNAGDVLEGHLVDAGALDQHHVEAATQAVTVLESDESAVAEPIRAETRGPATITDFPTRASENSAAIAPSEVLAPVTLVELIDRHNGLDWREAVAVIHQICLYLKLHAPHSPILLDPRNIQITSRGEVRLLSEQPSSDPLVVQVGRLLRAMLMGRAAPPELRLLLAQATFELPIFESIEEVERALDQLQRLEEPRIAGETLLQGVAAPRVQESTPDEDYRKPSRPILPGAARAARQRRAPEITGFRDTLARYGIELAMIAIALAIVSGWLLTRPSSSESESAARVAARPTVVAPVEAAPASSGPEGNEPPKPVAISGQTPRQPATVSQSRVARATVAPPRDRTAAAERPVSSGGSSANAAPNVTPGPPPGGRSAPTEPTRETSNFSDSYDRVVLTNPLYEPRPTELTPEALAAFRASQRRLLPSIAARLLERARTALADGDVESAITLANQVQAILARAETGLQLNLRDQVEDLLDRASKATASGEDILYSDSSVGVVPPRQISRGLPATSPFGIPANRIGTLEMIIARDGSVELVKLHTPLNRHHERMIVSPAKAWLFRPATKNGKPVRYRISVKVNLPESGTEDF